MQKDLFFTYNIDKNRQEETDNVKESKQMGNDIQEPETVVSAGKEADTGTASELKDDKHPVDHELEKRLESIDREDPHPGEEKRVTTKVIKTNQKKVSFKGIML